jgi:hypothetical protein
MPLFDNSKKSLILFYKLLGLLILFLGARVCYLGVYGFIGNNGIKIAAVKKIENSVQETSSEIKLKGVWNKNSIKIYFI